MQQIQSYWEQEIGYRRVVKRGNHICVSGTTASDENGKATAPTAAGQTEHILEKMGDILARVGAAMHDVIRVRMYVTDISTWQEVGSVFKTYFGNVQPAATMVEVQRLIDPSLLIEIEVDAIVESAGDDPSSI